jgi:FMN phosphatase YigB (HAD superfamily)
VTVDLWYTLLHLGPREEDRYMRGLEERGSALIAGWPLRASKEGDAQLAEPLAAFLTEFRAAVTAAEGGRSVPPAEQIRRAAELAGREARPAEYLDSLRDLVSSAPFEAAPGCVDFLRSLRAGGYRIGLVSNTVGEPGQYLRPVCDRLGIGEFIDVWAWSDELPWAKPSPEIFRWCLTGLGVGPGRRSTSATGRRTWAAPGPRSSGG